MNSGNLTKSQRMKRRWVGGAGVTVIGPVLFLLFRIPGVDHVMLGSLIGFFGLSAIMLVSSFYPKTLDSENNKNT